MAWLRGGERLLHSKGVAGEEWGRVCARVQRCPLTVGALEAVRSSREPWEQQFRVRELQGPGTVSAVTGAPQPPGPGSRVQVYSSTALHWSCPLLHRLGHIGPVGLVLADAIGASR